MPLGSNPKNSADEDLEILFSKYKETFRQCILANMHILPVEGNLNNGRRKAVKSPWSLKILISGVGDELTG
jgi:hypothetical protein